MTPKLLVFASGTEEGGGSGFENLVYAANDGRLEAEIVGVVSDHAQGGVRAKADRLGIPFIHFPGPYEAGEYQKIAADAGADFVALSGWLKYVKGLSPRTTFNIHPAPLPDYGGAGFFGMATHERVMEAYKAGKITQSAVSMHFVTDKFDDGPVFFSHPVDILPDDTPESLAHRVNEAEHRYQPEITNLVVSGKISWDGKEPASLTGARIDR